MNGKKVNEGEKVRKRRIIRHKGVDPHSFIADPAPVFFFFNVVPDPEADPNPAIQKYFKICKSEEIAVMDPISTF